MDLFERTDADFTEFEKEIFCHRASLRFFQKVHTLEGIAEWMQLSEWLEAGDDRFMGMFDFMFEDERDTIEKLCNGDDDQLAACITNTLERANRIFDVIHEEIENERN